MAGLLEVNNDNPLDVKKIKIDMSYELLAPIIAKVMAIEKTLLNSPFKEEYLKNKEHWTTVLDSQAQSISEGVKSKFED